MKVHVFNFVNPDIERDCHMKIFTTVILMIVVMPIQAKMYKCEAAGKIVYQQMQCKNGDTQSILKEKKSHNTNNSLLNFDISKYSKSKGYSDSSYSGSPYNQLTQATSYISIAKNLGRDCDWAIDVSKDMVKCMNFLAYISEHGAYLGALEKIINLLEEHPGLANGSTSSVVREGKLDAEKVEKYKNKAIIASKMF